MIMGYLPSSALLAIFDALLCTSKYRLQNCMSFFDWRVVPGFEIRLNKGTPDFTIVNYNWLDHGVESFACK